MMAVDSQRMMGFIQMANYLWADPLVIVIAIILLWQQLGIATLAGIGFMVILMPINGYISTRMRAIGVRVMNMKDKRVKLMNEILNGIKVFKLYAWETSFKDQVLHSRQKEVNDLNKMAYLSGFMTFSMTSAPFFVSSF